MTGKALIDLPVTRACIEKWNAGRAKHGETFAGNALDELYGELIDAINYCDQVQIEGLGDITFIRRTLYDLAHDVREIYVENMESRDER